MWWLLSCAVECDPERIPIVDASGSAASEQREAARDSLIAFERWTGREVCLGEVRFERGLTDHGQPLAAQRRGRRWIRIDLDDVVTPGLLQEAVFHELCHVLDSDEDITLDHPDLFGSGFEDVMDPVLYATAEDQRRERFALLCEDGPRRGLVAWPSACEPEIRSNPATEYVDEVVWREAPTEEPLVVGGSIEEIARYTLLPGERTSRIVGTDDAVWLTLEYQPGTTSPLFSKLLAFSVDGVLLDTWSPPVPWGLTLFGGRRDVLAIGFDRTVWRLSLAPDGVGAEVLDTPALPYGDLQGVEQGEAWVFHEPSTGTLYRWTPATGAYDGLPDGSTSEHFLGDLYLRDGRAWVHMRPRVLANGYTAPLDDGDPTNAVEIPGRTHHLAALSDGLLLASDDARDVAFLDRDEIVAPDCGRDADSETISGRIVAAEGRLLRVRVVEAPEGGHAVVFERITR